MEHCYYGRAQGVAGPFANEARPMTSLSPSWRDQKCMFVCFERFKTAPGIIKGIDVVVTAEQYKKNIKCKK